MEARLTHYQEAGGSSPPPAKVKQWQFTAWKDLDVTLGMSSHGKKSEIESLDLPV